MPSTMLQEDTAELKEIKTVAWFKWLS